MALLNKSIMVLFVLWPVTVFSHDLLPPAWRGQAGTTLQHWRFDTNANPAEPQVISNPYGQATATITIGAYGGGWLDDAGLGQSGIWDIGGTGGTIVLDIAGQPSTAEYTQIAVQVTYFQGISEAPAVNVPQAVLLDEQRISVSQDTLGQWYLHRSLWRIYPSAANTQVIFISNPTWGSVIDQIVVDTASVPAECIVDFDYLGRFCEQWLQSGSALEFDFDSNGSVDFTDFAIVAENWLDICPL